MATRRITLQVSLATQQVIPRDMAFLRKLLGGIPEQVIRLKTLHRQITMDPLILRRAIPLKEIL